MCQVLEVSRSGYYDWKDRLPSKRKLENQEILKTAQQSYDECHGMCGLDKILADVREKFPHCSRKRLYEIQKKNKLYAKRKKKFKATTNSNHKLPVAENLLNQDFTTNIPAAVWVTDISYINTYEGWLYLATVKDIFTKEIVGWATDNYDVPIYRNEVAHNGTIVSQEAEHIAIDILLDMYTVIKLMQQDWLPFNNLKSLIWQLKIYKQIPSLTNKYIDRIFIELYSFFMMRKEDGDFGVFRIMKNRDKYKDILEHYIMHYEDKTDTNLFDEAAELLQVLGQESFWQYTLDIIRDMGLSGTNFAQFVTILVNEFIGYLPKGSSSHRLCIKVKKELDAYNLSLHNG
jgi:hypothetical protein